ncbi:Nucleoside ABC transporter, permease protein 1 [Devosia sp. DBB001]|nr:Nucleoside ABC transporter, permease protein 1 [Devosia sp. DBB001]
MMRSILASLVQLATTVLVIAAVILVILVPLSLAQPDPGAVLFAFLLGPFDSVRHIGNIAEAATPIALTGLASTVIFRAGMFNLGTEGGFFLGGLGAAAFAIMVGIQGPLAAPLAILAGACIGSVACIVPGYLRVRHGAPEMVTSLVFNFALLFAGLLFLSYVLRDPTAGALTSPKIPADARLDRLLQGTRLNSGAIIAVLACIIGGIWLFATRSGLNTRIVGSSPGFAAHLGLPITRITMATQVVGGLIAGMAGAVEVLGLYTRFTWVSLPGLGWTGIIVAILARENPFLIIPAALFLGYLQVGGDILGRSMDIPSEIVGILTAAIMVAVTAKIIFENPRLLRAIRSIKQQEAK